jgi:hypothetical protein
LLVSDRARFWRSVRPRYRGFIVFQADASDVAMCPLRPGVSPPEIRALSKHDVESLVPLAEEIAEGLWAAEAFADQGVAWGAFVEGQFAHLSWVIPGTLDRLRRGVRLVKVRPGEVEITHCVTLKAFRGRHLYPATIRHLASEVLKTGARRLIMITTEQNVSSQRGIVEAGFTRSRHGIYRFQFAGLQIILRPFRWFTR